MTNAASIVLMYLVPRRVAISVPLVLVGRRCDRPNASWHLAKRCPAGQRAVAPGPAADARTERLIANDRGPDLVFLFRAAFRKNGARFFG